MNLQPYIMAEQDAVDCEFAPITRQYDIDEQWMLKGVISDMQRDEIEFVLVPVKKFNSEGHEVWRLKNELKLDEEQYAKTA